MKTKIRNSKWALPLLITLFAFALRVYRLGGPSLYGDEAFAARFTALPLREMLAGLTSYESQPPLYYSLLALWRHLAGSGEFALRFISAWFGALAVPLIYDLGRRLTGKSLGSSAALLTAINPYLVWHSQEARMYAMLAALGCASLALLLRAWQSGRRAPWRAWAAVTWLALFTHYFAAFLLAAQVLVLIVETGRNRRSRQFTDWAVPLGAGGLLYLPWLAYVAPAMLGHEKSWIQPVTLGEFTRRLFITYSLGTTAADWAIRWLWLGFLLILAAGFLTLARWPRWKATPISLCLLAPPLIVYLLSLLRPMFHQRYLIFILPLYLIVLAAGAASWARWVHSCARGGAISLAAVPLAFLLLAPALALNNYYHDARFAKSPPWREMVQYLEARSQPGDMVIQNYPDPSLPYYLTGKLPYQLVPQNLPFSETTVAETLTHLLNRHGRLWLVPTQSDEWDAAGLVQTWLDRHADLSASQSFGDLHLRLYLSPLALTEGRPPLAQFGEAVRLIGYRLSGENKPLKPGDALHLNLYWRTDAPLETSYTVFSHLLDPAGRMRGQKDNLPISGTYPTTAWQPGEIIVDRYEIEVAPDAPPGDYHLAAGLYDAATMARLPVSEIQCPNCPIPAFASDDRLFLPVEIQVGK